MAEETAERPRRSPRLLDELRESRRDFMNTFGPAAAVSLLVLVVGFLLIEPPPPKELVIAAGRAEGNYSRAARLYSEIFAEHGVRLRVRETAGSLENYDLLARDAEVQVAIVQGGTIPDGFDRDAAETLCTLYPEPLWVFCRGDAPRHLYELKDRKIGVGEPGSGSEQLAVRLLEANGLSESDTGRRFLHGSPAELAVELQRGKLDAAFFVMAAGAPLVAELLRDPEISLMEFRRADAYEHLFPYLEQVTLVEGVVSLQDNLPSHDHVLLAPAANLIAARDMHEALIPLFLQAAMATHEGGGRVYRPGDYPSMHGAELAPSPVARHSLKYGPPLLQKYLGFWAASVIDRTKILIVPLIVLLIPLVKLAPPVYRWRIRSRIYRWYALLRQIDQQFRDKDEQATVEMRETVGRIERELSEVSVPLSYMEEFYHLRLHIDLVKRRIHEAPRASEEDPVSEPH